MRKQILKLAALSVAMGAMSVSGAAFAQDEETAEEAGSDFDISGTIAVTNEYRFRGVDLSDGEDFAVQPGITIKHKSGLYVGAWGSNIVPNVGDDIEVDLYAGFAGGDVVTYDIGATYYLYPGVSNVSYVEFTGKLGHTIGPATIGAQLSYVPSQDNTGNSDNIYVAANASVGIPTTPFTLTGSLGYEDGAFANDKVDWSLGISASKYGFTGSVAYVDTNRTSTFGFGDSKAGVVFTLSYGF